MIIVWLLDANNYYNQSLAVMPSEKHDILKVNLVYMTLYHQGCVVRFT